MPELPEVETIRRTLEPLLAGRTIAAVEIRCPRIIHGDTPEAFTARIAGRTIRSLGRFGKYLFFRCDGLTLVSHLRMEGKYFLRADEAPGKHEHVIFRFADGTSLRYHDTRKFGTMQLVPAGTEMELAAIADMGPEPASPTFSGAYLARRAAASMRPVKSFLLDQDIVSGLGNIYVDETLAHAAIHPETAAGHLTPSEWRRVAQAAKTVIADAVAAGGTTIRSYVSELGVTGRFQHELAVHQRKGQPCRTCGTPIVKTTVGGRGTYFCPQCQQRKNGKGLVVGLTGGIASGKSTVGRLFVRAGASVCDADVLYKRLSKAGEPLYNEIVAAFGKDILDARGEIDYRLLGGRVFADPEARGRLDRITHPQVRHALEDWIAARREAGDELVVASVPLLFEAGFETACDLTVAVWCPPRLQLERLMKREGLSREAALQRIGAQMPLKEKVRRADLAIDNSGTPAQLRAQFATLLAQIRS